MILENRKELKFYNKSTDIKKEDLIHLQNVLVSNISKIHDRPFSFSLQTSPPGEVKQYFLSCDSQSKAEEWRAMFIEC